MEMDNGTQREEKKVLTEEEKLAKKLARKEKDKEEKQLLEKLESEQKPVITRSFILNRYKLSRSKKILVLKAVNCPELSNAELAKASGLTLYTCNNYLSRDDVKKAIDDILTLEDDGLSNKIKRKSKELVVKALEQLEDVPIADTKFIASIYKHLEPKPVQKLEHQVINEPQVIKDWLSEFGFGDEDAAT